MANFAKIVYRSGIVLFFILIICVPLILDCTQINQSEKMNDIKQAVDDEAYYNSLIDAYISANKTALQNVSVDNKTTFPVCYYPPVHEVYISFPNGAPLVNQQSRLKVAIWSKYSFKHADLEINLPDGIELINGNQRWAGDTPANGTIEAVNVIVSPVGTGDYEITATLSYPAQPSMSYLASQRSVQVYLITTETKALWDKWPVWRPKPSKYAGIINSLQKKDSPRLTEEELRIMDEKAEENIKHWIPAALCENGTVIHYSQYQ